jgi:hypothetical protein
MGAEVRVTSDEPALEARIALVGDTRRSVSLAPGDDKRSFSGALSLPPGHHRLRVVLADAARNETEREVEVDVPARGQRVGSP